MAVRAAWDNPEEFQEFLEDAQRHYGDTGDLMGRVAGSMRSRTTKRIDEGRLDAENAPVTKEVKQGDNPLEDSGLFLESITTQVTDETAVVGSPLKQAPVLQKGETITPTDAEKLAFPASSKTRTLQRKHGFDFAKLIEGMREDGWNVWFEENAVVADNPESNDDPWALLVRKEKVTIPAYRPFQLDDEDEDDIRGVIQAWLKDVKR